MTAKPPAGKAARQKADRAEKPATAREAVADPKFTKGLPEPADMPDWYDENKHAVTSAGITDRATGRTLDQDGRYASRAALQRAAEEEATRATGTDAPPKQAPAPEPSLTTESAK